MEARAQVPRYEKTRSRTNGMVDQAERHAGQQCQDCPIIEHIRKVVGAKALLQAQVKQTLGSKAWQVPKNNHRVDDGSSRKGVSKVQMMQCRLNGCRVLRQSTCLIMPYTRYQGGKDWHQNSQGRASDASGSATNGPIQTLCGTH